MSRTFFVTGTDTDAGKTIVTCGLLEAARQKQLQTIALKPVAAGCEQTPDGLRNDDALALIDAMTCQLPYEQVNPVALEPAIAPHIAAKEAGRRITIDRLTGFSRGALMTKHDIAFIEGAGGWRVPLNDREMLSGLASSLNASVILVVCVKLGCISHSLLTAESVMADGLKLAGWVANVMDPDMNRLGENLETLTAMMPAPCLGVVPFLTQPGKESVAASLDISLLI
ncbi:MAG: dethiobiotin synthase [Endozoicomonas sp.]